MEGAPSGRSDDPIPMTPRDPRRPFVTSPFARLARTHAFGIAGDGIFAIGLAGSVFFSLDFNSARWRVALYLVLTIAPFAVATPLIGPMIDRIKGGRRWIIVGSMAARAVLCFFVVRHLSSLLFYPEAFMMLVLGKVYSISKSAVVPSTVRTGDELVEANSKLTMISAIAVVVAAGPAGLLLKLGGPGWTLGLAMIVFAVATGFALKLPRTSVAEQPVDKVEREELRSAGIKLASSAMALVRGVVGFLSFMLAFDFKNSGAPLWYLGVVAATAQIGFFLGAIAAPRVRRVANEEQIIVGTLVIITLAGFLTSFLGGLQSAALLSAMVGATSSAARQAFDAIVQRDAPDANRGRTFARFEMRFQLIWVIGALLPIVIPIPSEIGFIIIGFGALFALVSYSLGLRRIRRNQMPIERNWFGRKKTGGDGADVPTSEFPDHNDEATTAAALVNTVQVHGSGSGADFVADRSESVGRTAAVDATAAVKTTTVVDTTQVIPGTQPGPDRRPAPPDQAGGTRGWMRSVEDNWEPPPGFVASPLTGERPDTPPDEKPWVKVFDGASTNIDSDAPADQVSEGDDQVQVQLTLDDVVVGDPVAGDGVFPFGSSPETLSYPEPVWRDSPQPTGSEEAPE